MLILGLVWWCNLVFVSLTLSRFALSDQSLTFSKTLLHLRLESLTSCRVGRAKLALATLFVWEKSKTQTGWPARVCW